MPEVDNTVDVTLPEVADDAQLNEGESLSTITEESQDEGQQKQDAGWFRQRIDKAVSKAVMEAEQRMAAKYESQLAEFAAERIERQAQELVRNGEFRSLDTAKEYLTLKSGRQPEKAVQAEEQPRQQETDPVIQARADLLAQQAHKIESSRGIDVMAAYNGDSEIQRKVASGEWDFYDVADYLAQKRNPPSPARTSNGAHTEKASIRNMTDKQFKALQDKIAHGVKYNLRE